MNKFVGIILTLVVLITSCQSGEHSDQDMQQFGQDYTDAWNSGQPEKMASYFAENGELIINNGTPSKGGAALAATAQSFMEAFPDLVLTMDSLVQDGDTFRYHWTFKGTYVENGNAVLFSGFEQWTMNNEGLVQRSIGTFDAEDYNRQLETLPQ